MRHNVDGTRYALLNAHQWIDTRIVEPGVYLYTIRTSGANKTGKIVINH